MKKFFNKKNIMRILFFIFLLGLIYSVCYFISYQKEDANLDKQLKKIEEVITNNDTDEPETNSNNTPQDKTEEYLKKDLNDLKEINSDVKGWIKVNGTQISYPFVQTNNNSYYLNHSFDKTENRAGWVFLDYRNNIDNLSNKNNILYAHNMRTKKMFGSLKNILTNGWLENKSNHVVELSTMDKKTKWQVFSVYIVPKTSDYIKTSFKNNEEFEEFLNMISERSIHDFNIETNANDKILTLSTCYNHVNRLVLHAKLIKAS